MKIQEIVFVAEICPVLRGGGREHCEFTYYEATGDRAGYSRLRQRQPRGAHHEVASGRCQGYLRVHPYQDSNGGAGNAHDPGRDRTNATVLFLPATSVDCLAH